MLGLTIMLLAFYLAAGLLTRRKPTSTERQLSMLGFVCLTPSFLSQRLPLGILSILLLLLLAYLHRAR